MTFNIDVIIVTYNSLAWIENCLNSIRLSQYRLDQLYIYIIDNNSNDGTTEFIQDYSFKEDFGSYNVILNKTNIGFGAANNTGVYSSNNEYILFLNADTEIQSDALIALAKFVNSSTDKVGMWEFRQFPYEHPKKYNPLTLDVSWCSAAACLVKRDIFNEVGKFDERLFMYAEDVDLSWRFRAHGYKIVYVPYSVVNHYTTPSSSSEYKIYNCIMNNILLRYKFGSIMNILHGYFLLITYLILKKSYSFKLKRKLFVNMFTNISRGYIIRGWYREHKYLKFKPCFIRWDYEITRNGADYYNKFIASMNSPLVSIIIRTVQRPEVLREALISARNQTYKNIEVIVVEDGLNASAEMIAREFSDINIVYHATMERVGRSKAGNLALSLANGEYFNFLDDDDILYPEHIEVLFSALKFTSGDLFVAYSNAFETVIDIRSNSPHYEYEVKHREIVYKDKYNYLVLLDNNFLPIQSVLFSSKLYYELGGFDESLEVLEDWDLWLKYANKCEFVYVDKTTSEYRVPYSVKEYYTRKRTLEASRNIIRDRYLPVKANISVNEIYQGLAKINKRKQAFNKFKKINLRRTQIKIRGYFDRFL